MNGFDIIKSSEAVHGVGSVIWLQEPKVTSPVTHIYLYSIIKYETMSMSKHYFETKVGTLGHSYKYFNKIFRDFLLFQYISLKLIKK